MKREAYEAAVAAMRESGLGPILETDHLSGDGTAQRHGTMCAEMSPGSAEAVVVSWLRLSIATGAYISIDPQPSKGDVHMRMFVLRPLTDEERAAMHMARRVA